MPTDPAPTLAAAALAAQTRARAAAAALGALALGAAGCAAQKPGLETHVRPCPPEIAATVTAMGGVSVVSKCMYYDVDGRTAAELRRFMSTQGPTDETGTYDAYTSFALRYGFEDVSGPGGCRTGPVAVELYLAHILPEWRTERDAPPDLRGRWGHFTERLGAHEVGHADISVRTANELAYKLRRLPVYPTCAALRDAAHEAFVDVVTMLTTRQRHYDWRTHHGKRQGSVFP